MYIKYLVIFLLVISSFSCSKKNDVICEFSKFPINKELEGMSIFSKDSIYFNPHKVFLVDSLIVVTTYDTEKCIYVFNKNNFKLLASAGHRGRGPNEIITPGYTCLDYKNKNFFMQDWGRARLASYSIDSILNNSNYHYSNFIIYPRILDPIEGLEVINDSIFLIGGVYERAMLFVINNKGDIVRKIGRLPEKTINYANDLMYNIQYSFRIEYIPNNDRVIVCFKHFDIFDIYDLKTNKKIKRYKGPDNIEPELVSGGMVNTNVSRYAYQDIKIDDKYLYCMYNGEKMIKKTDNEYGYGATWPTELHIHDLNGKPVMNIKLDRGFEEFVIDKETKRIITLGSARNSNEGLFRVYPYPEELLNN